MSIVNISFDTQQKTLYVSINGNKIDDVRSIYIDHYYEEEKPRIELVTRKESKEDGVVLENRIYASSANTKSKEGIEVVNIDNYQPKIFKY